MDEFKDILEEKDFKYYFEKYKIIILIIVLIVISLALLIFKLNKKEVKNNNKILTQTKEIKTEKKEEKVKTVKVDIKGEVLNPYVYELAINSRIIDVINKAGGLKEEADTTYINLSKKIKDEMVIIIYSKKEIEEYKKDKEQPKYIYIEKDCECPDEMNEACIVKKTEDKEEINTETNALISLNKAKLDELQTLPGIGKSKAENIIKYREENGSFKTIEDLKNVTGIGDSIFEKIKDQITI